MSLSTSTLIVIIDDELENFAGHPYEYNKSAAETFRLQGHKVEIYGNANVLPQIREELNVNPWFSFNSTMPIRKIPLLGGIAYRFYFSRAYQRQMTSLIHKLQKQGGDFILFETNSSWYNILPLARSWKKLAHPAAFLFRISIYDAIRVPGPMKPFIFPLIHHAARILKGNQNVHHFTDSEVIAEEWEQAFGKKMGVLPIPHLAQTTPIPYDPTQKKIRLYLPGGIRLEKGAALLTETMELLTKKQPEMASRIVLATQFPEQDAVLLEYKNRLAALPITNDFLGYLSSEEYQQQFEQAAIILIPYQAREGYRARTSGVLAEAIGAQKPSITTLDTWMAKQVEQYGAGLVIKETPEDFLEKLIELIVDYGSYQEKVKQGSKDWKLFHSKKSFYKVFCNEIRH